MLLNDLAQVVYAPSKAFKKIIENPKYLGALLVLLLFVGLAIGFEFVQFSRIYTENTVPQVGQLQDFLNSTSWRSSSNVALSDNFADPFNYSIFVAALNTNYSMFGNSSLEMGAIHTNNITTALGNVFNVDCNPSGFQNLSITIKQVAPSSAPQNAALTLFSLSDTSFYTYDLTSSLNSAPVGAWNNLTIPLGPKSSGWTTTGTPSWGNVTALQLSLNYPANSNITARIGALFFRGQYQTPVQTDSLGLVEQFLSSYGFEFILVWFVLTGIIYLFFYGMKTSHVWKPLFVATGYALIVLDIRALINIIAAATLPTLYYPFDITLGVRFNFYGATVYAGAASSLTTQSHAILNSINTATAGFGTIVFLMFAVSYIWIGFLSTIIVGTLKPEFSMTKRITIAVVSVAATVFLSLLLVGLV
ncbi:MAG: hypothetical protein ABSF44_06365 [Candidatus Bathyarchaeia archaeon]